MKEKIVIVFIAIILGLIITTAGFFLYQSTKIVPEENTKKTGEQKTTVTQKDEKEKGLYLTVDEPKDESIAQRRTIEVKGKTNSENTILVSTNQEDVLGKPASDGKFSVSVIIDTGTNKIITRAVSPSGEEVVDERLVTFTTEEF